jgi:hypothetical protein
MSRKRGVKPELNEKQAAYVNARASGKSRNQSAVVAGYNTTSIEELSPTVAAALTEEFKKNAKMAGVTREDIIQGLLDAANMGRISADPMSMIAAYRELGKLCGLYAPEVKKIEHELGKETLHALENLSDAELLRMSRGRVIAPGEITDVTVIEDKSGA